MRNNPKTKYRLQLALHADTPREVIKLLEWMSFNGCTRPTLPVAAPNHGFFFTPGWSELLTRAYGHIRPCPNGTWRLYAKGETNLEEQDIGLFLRWLAPYIEPTGRRPKRVAVVRNDARREMVCVSYFVRNSAIELCFVEAPLLTIHNFQAAA